MTDRVILGNPFMCLLYPFTTDSEGITTHPFDQPVKFKFLRSPEPREISSLQEVSVSKTLNLLKAKISQGTLANHSQAQNLDSFASTSFLSAVNLCDPSQSQISSQHIHHKNIYSLPSHVLNKCIFENSWKIHYASLNMFWQESKISPTNAWKMASSKNKGKAPIQGFPQNGRRQSFQMHEGASSGSEPRRATSLQNVTPDNNNIF